MTTSRVPTALAGLYSLLNGYSELAGVDVHDGKPMSTANSALEYIAVGWDDEDSVAVDFDQDWAALGTQRKEETFRIRCLLRTGSGDTSIALHRERAGVLLGAVENALRPDYNLGGVVRIAEIAEGSWQQIQDDKGAAVVVRFTVACRVRI